MICPLCGSNLELKQINFSSAIFVCLDLKCPYPVGSECIEVKRNYKDINSAYQKCSEKEEKKTLQNELSTISNENANDSKNCPQTNVIQSFPANNSHHTETYYDNQINTNKLIEDINLSHAYLDPSDLDDLDNFISELLK